MFVNQRVGPYDREADEHIVVYLDILGAANRIGAEDGQLQMNKLYSLYAFSMRVTREIAIEENKDLKFKIFSDNIVIAKRLSCERRQRLRDIRSLLMCAGHLQELAASSSVGWLLRGGITVGQLFVDDVMVWGDALLKAYDLESNVASYPRVIIDDTVMVEIASEDVFDGYVRRDFDGLHFLNFLCNCHSCGEMLQDGFQMMQEEIGANMSNRIFQKLFWHMNFVNAELDRKDEWQDRAFRLAMSMERV